MGNTQDALKIKHLFGLLGKDIDYSFSRNYFSKKFEQEDLLDHAYVNFDIATVDHLNNILETHANLKGINVTIPYKQAVIPYLDKLHKTAKKIGAVNTIRISKKGKLIGYNTDGFGFKKALKPHLKRHHKRALILGTGGASKAIAYTLKQLDITYAFVSRSASKNVQFTYDTLSEDILSKYTIIINCTPLGTFPNIDEAPKIPYQAISSKHLFFDLIYNPVETRFLKLGKQHGAATCNGLEMLIQQADKAWKIWSTS